jgi:hypothetical protein
VSQHSSFTIQARLNIRALLDLVERRWLQDADNRTRREYTERALAQLACDADQTGDIDAKELVLLYEIESMRNESRMSDDELRARAEAAIARFDTDNDKKLSSGEELKAWSAAHAS